MSKKRKQHQLIATIQQAYLGHAKSKTYKNQPFYFLDIMEETLLGTRKGMVYAFANLVSQDLWKVLEQGLFKGKKYLLNCEKRVRGWRLREGKEIN